MSMVFETAQYICTCVNTPVTYEMAKNDVVPYNNRVRNAEIMNDLVERGFRMVNAADVSQSEDFPPPSPALWAQSQTYGIAPPPASEPCMYCQSVYPCAHRQFVSSETPMQSLKAEAMKSVEAIPPM